VPQIVFKPDWDREGRATPFKRNDRLLEALPIGVGVFPGAGISANLGFEARHSGVAFTMYILPCLYAFIGAAAAAIIGLRRKFNASLLSYSDRGWVKQAMLLGFVFGGVIGLFAGYLSKSPESDGLGLSALALLAGYNVPAVSELLEDLSKRIFRPGERDAQGAKAAC
jgi:hypothetical protein